MPSRDRPQKGGPGFVDIPRWPDHNRRSPLHRSVSIPVTAALPASDIPHTEDEVVAALEASGLMNADWYLKTYPDVAALGMAPARHYVRYGAAMGRNPSRAFNTRFYLNAAPEIREIGLNPLLHYLFVGQGQGIACKPASPKTLAKQAVDMARYNLLSLGIVRRALSELTRISQQCPQNIARALAARELAMWKMRQHNDKGYVEALDLISQARGDAPDTAFQKRLTTLELLCHFHLNQCDQGIEAWAEAVMNEYVDVDVMLARVTLARDPQDRIALINDVLARYDIAPLHLGGDDQMLPYDRLTTVTPPAQVSDGPLVTVLIAAWNAAQTIPTALRALSEQSWQNLEILVLDDCSTDATPRVVAEHAARDKRIRLIEMAQNGGAYVARNRGLDEAQGRYVTLHDADDWSHPLKIETQVRHLEARPDLLGCMTQQARMQNDLGFTRWTGRGQFLIPNTSSFMFRRAEMRAQFGYWDSVRFSADAELIRRMQFKLGKDAVETLQTGPFSFQRDSDSSIIADDALGINGFLFGARKEYFDAQRQYRETEGADLLYGDDPGQRPFPAPLIMQPDRAALRQARGHVNLVLAGDFRVEDDAVKAFMDDLRMIHARGLTAVLVDLYDDDVKDARSMWPEMRALVDGQAVRMLCYGEEIACDLAVVRQMQVLRDRQRYVPKITPDEARIVLKTGRIDRDLMVAAHANLTHYTNVAPLWHPVDDTTRTALSAAAQTAGQKMRIVSKNWPGTERIAMALTSKKDV